MHRAWQPGRGLGQRSHGEQQRDGHTRLRVHEGMRGQVEATSIGWLELGEPSELRAMRRHKAKHMARQRKEAQLSSGHRRRRGQLIQQRRTVDNFVKTLWSLTITTLLTFILIFFALQNLASFQLEVSKYFDTEIGSLIHFYRDQNQQAGKVSSAK